MIGCGHGNTSRAWTLNDRTYVVCLDCGTEIDYDLARMARIAGKDEMRQRNLRRSTAAVAGGMAVMVVLLGWLCR